MTLEIPGPSGPALAKTGVKGCLGNFLCFECKVCSPNCSHHFDLQVFCEVPLGVYYPAVMLLPHAVPFTLRLSVNIRVIITAQRRSVTPSRLDCKQKKRGSFLEFLVPRSEKLNAHNSYVKVAYAGILPKSSPQLVLRLHARTHEHMRIDVVWHMIEESSAFLRT